MKFYWVIKNNSWIHNHLPCILQKSVHALRCYETWGYNFENHSQWCNNNNRWKKRHDSIVAHQNLMKTMPKTLWALKTLDILVDKDKTQYFIRWVSLHLGITSIGTFNSIELLQLLVTYFVSPFICYFVTRMIEMDPCKGWGWKHLWLLESPLFFFEEKPT